MSTKALESLIVVAIHVAHQKVEDGEVDQVQQTTTLIIRVNVPNDIAIVRVRFPLGLPPLVVAPTPWVPPGFPEDHFYKSDVYYMQSYVSPWCEVFGREKSSKASFEHVWAAADRVRCVAVVGALAWKLNKVGED